MTETDLGPHAAFYERIFALDEQIKAKYGDGDGPTKGGPGLPGRQRAGLVMLEVTEKCNLTCPMCYAGSNPDGRHYTMAEIEQRLDEIVAAEGAEVSLQISGGEPSVRKDLKELAALIKSKGFTNFEMISNGIRIARDADFAESLKAWGFTSVYLQWDSLRESDIELLRGEKLLSVRLKALDQLEKAGLNTTLAVSLLPGLNTDQIGPILEVCRQHPIIRAVSFQAATPFGNRWDVDEEREGDTIGHARLRAQTAPAGHPATDRGATRHRAGGVHAARLRLAPVQLHRHPAARQEARHLGADDAGHRVEQVQPDPRR